MFKKVYIVIHGGVVEGVFGDKSLDVRIIDKDVLDEHVQDMNNKVLRHIEDLKSSGTIIAID